LTRIVNGKIPFNEYWYIVRESLTEGEIKKSILYQTVNPLKKGGSAGKEIFDDSKSVRGMITEEPIGTTIFLSDYR
jgi:hypothetical protein